MGLSIASQFELGDSVTEFYEFDNNAVLEPHEIGEFYQAATPRAAMPPFDLAAPSDTTIFDKDFRNRAMGLVKFNCDGADDVDKGFDAHMSTGIGNTRAVADEIANNVRRTQLSDHFNVGTDHWESDKSTGTSFDFVAI